MTLRLDRTHDPEGTSWVESAAQPGCPFPLQNLPFGMYRRRDRKEAPRPGVAIGDQILALSAIADYRDLNALAATGRRTWRALRGALFDALSDRRTARRMSKHLTPMRDAVLTLPIRIGNYSDFYAGIHHAEAVGRLFRPENPLLANYERVPIAYHGRASTIVVSGTPITRPNGQTRSPGSASPSFAPSERMDFELELGFIVGPASRMGRPVPVSHALDHVFGVVMLNDSGRARSRAPRLTRVARCWSRPGTGRRLCKCRTASAGPSSRTATR